MFFWYFIRILKFFKFFWWGRKICVFFFINVDIFIGGGREGFDGRVKVEITLNVIEEVELRFFVFFCLWEYL